MKNFVRLLCLLFVMSSVIPAWSQEKVDLETIGRIRYEGFRDSHGAARDSDLDRQAHAARRRLHVPVQLELGGSAAATSR